jgi:Dyp-type peroxidase family
MTQTNQLTPAAKADIQGFITSGFGHLAYGAYLFVEVRERARAQQWLQQLLQHITTSESWRLHPGEPKQKPTRTLNVAFTYAGLSALGMSSAALCTFPAEFRVGMADETRSRILGDTGASAPSTWELGGPQNEPIHALLILNAQSEADLDVWCSEQRQWLRNTLGAVVEQVRSTQYGARPESDTEHFGFFDGVAQPPIEGIKGKGVRTGEFIFGYQNEYGFFPVGPVVSAADDPKGILPVSANPFHRNAGYRDFGFNGTFVVYRKLAQHVAAFWRFLQDESVRLQGSVDPQFMVWLATKMVGRWPSGAPLVLAPDGDRPDLRSDDFAYAASDPNALACPFGSHIRRTNPRDQIGRTLPAQSLHMSSRHRILRRGKPYGPPLFDPAVLAKLSQPQPLEAIVNLQDDGQARGVHFLCVNASIKSQFEFIQQVWVNNPAFSGLLNNRDPITGDNDPVAAPSVMLVPSHPSTLRTALLPRFVTVRGGAYLFMPSVTALRYLAELD